MPGEFTERFRSEDYDMYIWRDSSGLPVLMEWHTPDPTHTIKSWVQTGEHAGGVAKRRQWIGDATRTPLDSQTQVYWKVYNKGETGYAVTP